MQVVIRVKGKQCMVQQAAGCQGLPPRRCLYSSVPCTYPGRGHNADVCGGYVVMALVYGHIRGENRHGLSDTSESCLDSRAALSIMPSAWSVSTKCRLTVVWVDCRCCLSFVFLVPGGERRLELSLCNTHLNPAFDLSVVPVDDSLGCFYLLLVLMSFCLPWQCQAFVAFTICR